MKCFRSFIFALLLLVPGSKFCSANEVLPSPNQTRKLTPIPDKLVVLTFDDSVKSHFTYVRSVLLKHNFGATFFITEGFDFPTNKRDYMSWEEIARLHSDGFEIGNHTRDHMSVTARSVRKLTEQLEAINAKCEQYGIPRPVSFAWPGNAIHPEALAVLRTAGIKFARRGGEPEYSYEKGRGVAYEPGLDHPLLIPSAADARPKWELDDFVFGASQAHSGQIAVLQFHGVPDLAHPWVNSSIKQFEQYMQYLADNNYKVIAMRDLEKYVDPDVVPSRWDAAIVDRARFLKSKQPRVNFRPLESDAAQWLENMIIWHGFSPSEISAATGLSNQEVRQTVKQNGLTFNARHTQRKMSSIKILPYPGGRHPRTGFLDGAIRPQRETKLSVFLPWNPQHYVVLDIPEAIRRDNESRNGLLYLAHSHVDTMWTKRGIALPYLEWQPIPRGFECERTLPNNVTFGTRVEVDGANEKTVFEQSIRMEMWLTNHSQELLSNLVVQNCQLLKMAPEFSAADPDTRVVRPPFIAVRSSAGDHWTVMAWTPNKRAWANPPCPCIHSDPQFPDCLPGETKRLHGWFSFFKGSDIESELNRIESIWEPLQNRRN